VDPLEIPSPLPDAQAFSKALAIDGDTLVAGTYDPNPFAPGTGGVSVHVRDEGGPGAWGEVAILFPPAGAEQGFGGVADISGDTVVVGVVPVGTIVGEHVYIYERNPSGGFDLSKIVDTDVAGFGTTVAIGGNTMVVGRDLYPVPAQYVLVFERDQGGPDNWGRVGELASPSPTGYNFGRSISISGDTIVVGDDLDSSLGSLTGSATVFERTGGVWGVAKQLDPPNGLSGQTFGRSVSVAGHTVLVGADNAIVGAQQSGAVWVFERDQGGSGNWGMSHQVTAPDPLPQARFGFSVALAGDLAVVGSPTYYPPSCANIGRAYLFGRDQGGIGEWGTVAILDAPGACGDNFGRTIGIAGTPGGSVAVVGAPNTNQPGPTGSVYVYDQVTAGCTLVYCTAGTSANGCRAALDASGTASASSSSGFTLLAAGVEGQKDGLYFFGANGRQANSWGNGTSYQCVVPPVTRAGLLTGVGTTGLCDGSFAQDLNALWCPTCTKPTKNPGAGATVQAQLWFRDPSNTSNQSTSLSNALEFFVNP